MKIQSSNQKFNGIKIASAKAKLNGAVVNYDLYRLTPDDVPFLEKLSDNIDLQQLWPNGNKSDYLFWFKALGGWLNFAKSQFMESVLIVKDGVPCGGINSKKQRDVCEVGYRVTWPIAEGEKAPFAGKILYLDLFKKCLDSGIRSIRTSASRSGPFDVVSKCYELGFCSNGGDNYTELMGIGRARMSKAIEKFKEFVEINPIPESEQKDVDLLTTLYIK